MLARDLDPDAFSPGGSTDRRRLTKIEREMGYAVGTSISKSAAADSSSSTDHSHSHSHSSTETPSLTNIQDPPVANNVQAEMRRLRAEISRLRAREAERSWDDRGHDDDDVLPAYESGPPRALPPHPPELS
jgi:hypothetical protein